MSAAPLSCRSAARRCSRQRGRRTAATGRGPVAPGLCRPVAGDVENPCGVGDLGHDGDGDEEDEDRPYARQEVGEVGAVTPVPRPAGAQRAVTSRTQGCPVRAGSGRVTSKASATTSASAAPARVPPLCTGVGPPARGCAWPCGSPREPAPAPSARRASPSGVHAAAYVLERQSTTTPRPRRRGSTRRSSGFQALASGPTPGRLTAIDRRYGAIASVGRTAPYRAETTTSQRLARRLAALSRRRGRGRRRARRSRPGTRARPARCGARGCARSRR